MVADADFSEALSYVKTFIQREVLPREQEIADLDQVPPELVEAAREMGLFGYALPEEYGGWGLSMAQEVELVLELSYAIQAFRSVLGTGNGIAGQVLVNFGTDEQRKTWLPKIASGEVMTSFALTEEGAGSNPAALQSSAIRQGGDWVINGHKRFISHAPTADLFMVFARVPDEGVAVFLVPADSAGLTVAAPDRKMGGEGSQIADVYFDDVRVPEGALVGDSPAVGFRAAMTSLARGRVVVAASAVGAAQRAFDESVTHASRTHQGDTVIGQFQLVQAMLADQQTQLLAGRSLVRHVAAVYDEGGDRRILPSAAKLFCTEMLGTVADLAVQIHGGSGYMRGMPVERIYREARVLRLFEGTSEIQRLIIGSRLVKDARASAT
ncbi:acyl-CoA dehydrogenase family protein [Streptomyces sp. NPDC005318]|uniref:acyl-CoA dehydrogenase family protein n=1 Tax=Streptomyces sp. NPDC005318 TaxID=3157031 RepID=UPI0033ABCD6E